MKKFFNIIMLIFIGFTHAQVGINTSSPKELSSFHVDSNNNNLNENISEINKQSDDFIIIDKKVGIGNTNPLVSLDVRTQNIEQNSAIGIGFTNQSASNAKAGAIRYNPTNKKLEYSDGIVWNIMSSYSQKVFVFASKSTNLQSAESNVNTVIDNWKIQSSTHPDSFNEASGIFTAPKDGYYLVSASYAFTIKEGNVAGSRIETIINGRKCINSFNTSSADLNNGNGVGSYCTSTVYLNKDQTLRITIYHNLGITRNLRVDATGADSSSRGFNFVTIAEQ